MAAENIIPTQAEVPSVRAALWQHYWQHLWLGAAIWVGIGLCFMAYELISSLPIGNEHIPEVGSLIEVGFGIGFVFLFWPTLLAALGGLLRQPALTWLSRRAHSQVELLGGSLLLFEASVAIATILGWCYLGIDNPINLLNSFLTCFFISLPWLLTTAWASWHLATRLSIPARRQ